MDKEEQHNLNFSIIPFIGGSGLIVIASYFYLSKYLALRDIISKFADKKM